MFHINVRMQYAFQYVRDNKSVKAVYWQRNRLGVMLIMIVSEL